jgi:hypothetical protein
LRFAWSSYFFFQHMPIPYKNMSTLRHLNNSPLSESSSKKCLKGVQAFTLCEFAQRSVLAKKLRDILQGYTKSIWMSQIHLSRLLQKELSKITCFCSRRFSMLWSVFFSVKSCLKWLWEDNFIKMNFCVSSDCLSDSSIFSSGSLTTGVLSLYGAINKYKPILFNAMKTAVSNNILYQWKSLLLYLKSALIWLKKMLFVIRKC